MNKTEQRAKEALEEIVNPIKVMRDNLQEGEQLNGGYAAMLANDANYLRNIAKKVLDEIAGATEAKDDWKRVEDEMRSLLKYIGEKGYYVNDDGSVWKDAFLYGKEIDVVAEYRNLPSPPSNDKPNIDN